MSRATAIFMMGLMAMALFVACRRVTVEVTRVEPEEVTRVSVETIVEEGTVVEVTRRATREVEVPVVDGSQAAGSEELVTIDFADTSDISTLDPQLASDGLSIENIENMFVQLTNRQPATGETVPEAATGWEISPDGRVYTFYLRGDIPWVYHNPVSGETRQVQDESGQPRFVTAHDFANGIRRACDPDLVSFYSGVIARLIDGCQALLNSEGSDAKAALLESLGVQTPDDKTLVVELVAPAGYFISATPLWTLSAIPSWTVEEHGDNWIEAGNIVTSGRYVLAEWVHGVRWTLVRNPLLPEDLRGEGNIERIVTRVVENPSTIYGLWLQGEVDVSDLPDAEVQSHLEQYAQTTIQVPGQSVFYIGFVNTKPPFDDVQVRRAFSAAIDRETLVRAVRQNQGSPMIHFAPPGVFGAPPIDEVGVGFDPSYARAELAAAGFPGCEGFPPVSLLGFVGDESLNLIEFLQAQWEEHLNCPAQILQIEQQPFDQFLPSIDPGVAVESAPHMYTLGWGPDYMDENNWVGDVLWCDNESNPTRRPCTAVDAMIVEAAQEGDPARRIELYRQIEESFFGPQGEMPIAPLFLHAPHVAFQEWLAVTPANAIDYTYNWSLDWKAKQQGRE